ncbi:atypical/RIO/RIO2 protein kinase [Thecamonas trahens ATCC 50062]|uniref:Serine/threonine-protein kinase RIO2 n=1 Tax=Thecamonas trahens ATCC 50062 TaxID=461836 RepID=A0A0L0DNA0_THETB|nr:atypical/RIO/RIO2 protein kinase [Thecamonas trahens ATCC 50062]KNC53496.1 atypical/RIO/RIO2 protein kinase [Thecamonas trahens ATCC 50062]|eukprot:XP_013761817.1 atypical/RIO/RIO2 protein kinase [Thecamonas trahens ATCC 50062]
MKLDVTAMRYITKKEFRVLTAVEMGMKNHQYVPTELISSISGLKHGGVYKLLGTLAKHKLVHHEQRGYDGYKITFLGYDFLALRALLKAGEVASVGHQVGVGKESDIFLCANEAGEQMVLKLHRLGRTSFRTIKNNRDYHGNRSHASWLYLSRLSAKREFDYMSALHTAGFPVPDPIANNRHCVVMSLIEGSPLSQVRVVDEPALLYERLLAMVVKFAEHGVIHGDFNEFNIMITADESDIVVIDFPQIVSTNHPDAEMYFDRDVHGVVRFLRSKLKYEADVPPPDLADIVRVSDLDVAIQASGYNHEASELDQHHEAHGGAAASAVNGASSGNESDAAEPTTGSGEGQGESEYGNSDGDVDGDNRSSEVAPEVDAEAAEGAEQSGTRRRRRRRKKEYDPKKDTSAVRSRLKRQQRQKARFKRRNRVKNRSAIEDRRAAKERW